MVGSVIECIRLHSSRHNSSIENSSILCLSQLCLLGYYLGLRSIERLRSTKQSELLDLVTSLHAEGLDELKEGCCKVDSILRDAFHYMCMVNA